jgi:hypothetical protein
MLETMFSARSVQRGYKVDNWGDPANTHVEAGSNTSTVTVRVVGGDEKGSLKSETVKYDQASQGLAPEKDYAGEASSIYRRQNNPLVREGAQ